MTADDSSANRFARAQVDAAPAPGQAGLASPTMRGRRARIALFGLFGCGNLGNDGSLEAMIEFLRHRRPDAELVCICDNPDEVTRKFGIATRPISWSRHLSGVARKLDRLFLKIPGKMVDLAQTLRHIRNFDLVIVPGTGILDDFGERPYGMPFDIFRWCLGARVVGARIALVSIGAGPIRHGLSRRLMTAAARMAHYRSYRDSQSKEFMESIGLDTGRDLIFPDIAFKLQAPRNPLPGSAGADRLTVGVGVMSYYGWYGFARGGEAIFAAYIEKLAKFVVHLLDNGHDVRLLTGELTDKTAVDALVAELGRADLPSSRVIAEPSLSLHDLMLQISAVDIVVATRFHNVVCALKLGRPTISLGYARKNDVLMEEMGLGALCQHVERFDVESLIEQFATVVRSREAYRRRITERVRQFEDDLDRQDAHLLTLV
ncbi:polysaccharide pyruvyl transferase family protein [Ensifer sp. NBAIM29]|nr:polysaccharide pyruvyl transferase family protein [Ensifer sp. NBAIM29]